MEAELSTAEILSSIFGGIAAIAAVVAIYEYASRRPRRRVGKSEKDTGDLKANSGVNATQTESASSASLSSSASSEDGASTRDFFISYAHEDQNWAEWIAWVLEEEGFSTLLQAWDFVAGSNFVLEMDKATRSAARTVAVLSPAYFASDFTPSEWAAAFAKDAKGEKRKLLPIRVAECDVEGLLKQIIWVDLVGCSEAEARHKLVAAAREERRKPLVRPGFPGGAARQVPSEPVFPTDRDRNTPTPRRNLSFTGREDALQALQTTRQICMTAVLPPVILELAAYRVNILHLSDLHEQAVGPTTTPARRDSIKLHAADRHRILGASFLGYLSEMRDDIQPHMLCFTGDIADFGLPEEYETAKTRIEGILDATGLSRNSLFIVPGNHDMRRGVAVDAWSGIRTASEERDSWPRLSAWLASRHAVSSGDCRAEWREAILERSSVFWSWAALVMGRPHLAKGRDGLGQLGYAIRTVMAGFPFPIHVVGLDSAWLSGERHEEKRLLLTHAQYSYLPCDADGHRLDGFCMGIIHHPLECLADCHESRAALAGRLQLLLHGHSHWRTEAEIREMEGSYAALGTGTLYEDADEDDWWHSFSTVECYLDKGGRLLAYAWTLHSWDPQNAGWHGWSRPARITAHGFSRIEEAVTRGECGLASYEALAKNLQSIARTMGRSCGETEEMSDL